MVQEIQAKVLLAHVKQPDPWFGLKYNMNLYRGCQHQCIYCDSRSQCYGIDNFAHIQIKANALELLPKELASKRVKGTIGTGSMHDPYMPIEKQQNLTGRALELIAQFCFPVHIITKGDLILRDMDTITQISQVYAAVSFTLTTTDDGLARKVEPGAASPSARLAAMKRLAERGIYTGVAMMPILPFIEDSTDNITQIIKQAQEAGATYIIPGFGVTLRDRQRAYYYRKLDKLFPGLTQQYKRQFGNQYFAPARKYEQLKAHFYETCARLNMATRITPYSPTAPQQLALF